MEQPIVPCPGCGGTGFAIVEANGRSRARPCSCRTPGRPRPSDVEAFLEEARVPRRYRECEFDNFDSLGNSSQILSLEGAKSLAIRFAEEYPLNDQGLLIMGSPGVGKTHLAVATLRRLMLEKGVACLFCDVGDLLRQLQGTFDRQSKMSELELLQPVATTEVVLLDELGGRQYSPWVEETLAHVVTSRYNDKRVTLVTTNYFDEPIQVRPNDPKERRPPTLEERIGPRVRSRLHEMCKVVTIEAEDYRLAVRRTGADYGGRGHGIRMSKEGP